MSDEKLLQMNARFQGYLPVVVDVETGGVNVKTDALLEVGAVFLQLDPQSGVFSVGGNYHSHVEAFEGSNIEERALEINHIKPHHPFRFASPEKQVIEELFAEVDAATKKAGCRRAILVGHNAQFDLSFIQAAAKRSKIHKSPFHAFTTFDTATLGAFVYGKTVLARALKAAEISFDEDEAHSALYDAEKTAELLCKMLNQQGWPGKG